MGDSTRFDFPASTSFREYFHDEQAHARRRHLFKPPQHSDEELLHQYIYELEDENFRLRTALDIATLALGQRSFVPRLEPPKPPFPGVDES